MSGREHRARLQPDERVAGQAEVAGGHGPAADRHLGVLAAAGRSTPRPSRPRSSSSRARTGSRRTAASSTPAAGRSGSGRCSTPPARSRTTTGSWAQLFLRVRELYEQGGRDAARADPEPEWDYTNPATRRSTRSPRRSTAFDLTTGKRVPGFSALKDDGTTSCRQLALLRLLSGGGEPDAAPGDDRPDRPRLLPRLGLVLAGQPAHPLQPRVGRRRREAVGPDPARHPVERHRPGSATSPTSRRTSPPSGGQGQLHHDRRGRGPAVRPGLAARRAVPRALRAGGVAGRQPACRRPRTTRPSTSTRTPRTPSPPSTPSSPTSPPPTG